MPENGISPATGIFEGDIGGCPPLGQVCFGYAQDLYGWILFQLFL